MRIKITPKIKRLISSAFPEYRGRIVNVITDRIPNQLNSYWDGGSKDYWCFVHKDTGRVMNVESNHPFFERDKPRDLVRLPENVLLLRHSIFCGKDCGITIYVNLEENNLIEDQKLITA